MTSECSGDGFLESVREGQAQAKTETGSCSPFPAMCQGLITAQTLPADAGTAPDGPSATVDSNLQKSSQRAIGVAPVQRCYDSVIDFGSVYQRVII